MCQQLGLAIRIYSCTIKNEQLAETRTRDRCALCYPLTRYSFYGAKFEGLKTDALTVTFSLYSWKNCNPDCATIEVKVLTEDFVELTGWTKSIDTSRLATRFHDIGFAVPLKNPPNQLAGDYWIGLENSSTSDNCSICFKAEWEPDRDCTWDMTHGSPKRYLEREGLRMTRSIWGVFPHYDREAPCFSVIQPKGYNPRPQIHLFSVRGDPDGVMGSKLD